MFLSLGYQGKGKSQSGLMMVLQAHIFITPTLHYRQVYYEAIDCTINCVKKRFDQPGYWVYCYLKRLLCKACKAQPYEEELDFICEFYKDDFNKENLVAQLQILTVHFATSNTSQSLNVLDLTKYFKSLIDDRTARFNESSMPNHAVDLVMPATNATSERSFSTLRRTKIYLRSTMKQERLNNFMILHIYSEQTDAINDNEIAIEQMNS